MPLGDGITFKYGDYEFSPRPLFTVNKEVIKTPSNTGIATKYSLTLNGTILPTGLNLDDNKGGMTTVLTDAQDLRDAFAKDFEVLLLKCDDKDPIISGYPKVINIDIANAAGDNYVRQATYTITLELPTLIGARSEAVGLEGGQGDMSSSGLISLSQDTSIEFFNERVGTAAPDSVFNVQLPSVFTITKNVSAQGDSLAPTDTEDYIDPWQRAKNYVQSELCATGDFSDYFSGVMCVDGLNIRSTFKTLSVNKSDGSCAGSQTYIALPAIESGALEDFEGSSEQSSDTPFTSITVNGTIQGIDYIPCGNDCPPTGNDKFEAALTKWASVSGSLYSRAKKVLEKTAHLDIRAEDETYPLHQLPLSSTVGYNPIAGTVTYSYSYNDRLDFIDSSAITETISVTENGRPDLYASITILGRGSNGPLLQSLGATGPQTKDVSVDVIYKPTSDYNNIPATATEYNTLFTDPDNSFVTSDTETWEAAAGHYTRSKSWEIGSC